ncbi:unnamed protein product [Peronospora belbahrii]|uniref:Chloride channel protein n=1 Tax=Peronospora belbahrii TaxID=622444 RepID=A0AAU9KP05_9STRA|nr:unnamed protein product [Peronospora belbahrii]CAH0520757.1 unnamed protein product [Peronospora belbahrii]
MLWTRTDLESLDYDLFESVVNKSGISYKYRNGQEKNRLIYARWFLTLVTGVITALVAVFMLYFTTLLTSLKQHLLEYTIQHELAKNVVFGTTFWSIVAFNLGLVAIAATVTSFGEPVAAGSGISEVKMTLNGMKIPRMLRLRTFFCKVIGTVCSVAGGLPVGKEGPMIHSGAIVAAGLSQGKSSTIGYDTSFSYFGGFRNDREKRDFVACGAAAGVASAFGAPIGGVLFVLEEGASFWNQTLTWRTLFCAMSATFTLAFFLSGMNDNLSWGTLGSHTGSFSFGPFTSSTYQIWEVPLFIMMGIGGGLQGALFNGLNTRLAKTRSRWVRTRGVAWMEALLLSVLISSLLFTTPFLLGKCHELPRAREDVIYLANAGGAGMAPNKAFVFGMEMLKKNSSACICESCSSVSMEGAECFQTDETVQYPYKKELLRFYCPEGQYNDLASLMLTGGEVAIKHLFHAPPDSFDVRNLVVFWLMMLFLSCLTYGLKIPSGLFVPALLIGAAYGRLWTRVINYFTGLQRMKTVDPRTYGLVGSLAMLGGVTRMTISLTVIILECTGNIEFGLPLILTSFFARWVGNYFNEGIYDIHIHLRRAPFLDWNPPLRGAFLRVKHVMTPNPKTLRTVERAGVIFDLLVSTKHNAFPVIVEDPTFGSRFFAGVILRKQLNVLLSHHDFSVEKPKPFHRQPHPASYQPDVATTGSLRRRRPGDLEMNNTPRVDDKLLESPLASNYCLSYHDMEAHYPRYPIPTPMHQDFQAAAHAGRIAGDELYTLAEEDRALWVDLTPYMNQTPYLIQEEAPFVRAYRLFRSAGLRHLVVVNRHNNVRGIITRHELEEEHCTRCFRLVKDIDTDDVYPLSGAPPVGFFRTIRRKVLRTEQVKRALISSIPIARDGDNDNQGDAASTELLPQ